MIHLTPLSESHITEEYVSWMNDYEIVKYTESRSCDHTLETLRQYLESVDNSYNFAFAIIDSETNTHIGNVKIGDVNLEESVAHIGIIIGNKNYQGKGISFETYNIALNYAFNCLNLNCIETGCVADNIRSVKLFRKFNFSQYSMDVNAFMVDDILCDVIHYRLFKKDYNSKFKQDLAVSLVKP